LRSVEWYLPAENRAADKVLAELVGGGLRPAVSAVHPLAEAGQALRDMADRRATGKIVLTLD
jgi:NADPH:quinone reductase